MRDMVLRTLRYPGGGIANMSSSNYSWLLEQGPVGHFLEQAHTCRAGFTCCNDTLLPVEALALDTGKAWPPESKCQHHAGSSM